MSVSHERYSRGQDVETREAIRRLGTVLQDEIMIVAPQKREKGKFLGAINQIIKRGSRKRERDRRSAILFLGCNEDKPK